MTEPLVLQYVAFTTSRDTGAFLSTWTPFALRFKGMGIEVIDLYRLSQGRFTFVSRNVWPRAAYAKAFPPGIADAGASSEVEVTQLGGFFASESARSAPPTLTLGLVKEPGLLGAKGATYPRCAAPVPFVAAIELSFRPSGMHDAELLFGEHVARL